MKKAIFLDRDGTINVDYGYVSKIEDFQFIEGAKEGLKILYDLGYKLIIITNQSGIARGYYTEEDAKEVFDYMIKELLKENIKIEKIYYCPHLGDECECRKPKLELFYRAQKEFDIDFSSSYAIGDKLRDLSICNKEEVKGFLINSKEEIISDKIIKCKSLLEAAILIQKEEKQK